MFSSAKATLNNAPLAQSVEQRTVNPFVAGSSPAGGVFFYPFRYFPSLLNLILSYTSSLHKVCRGVILPTMARQVSADLFQLFFVFFKIGAVTFGGGTAMLPILEHELVHKKKWTTVDQLLDYYTIGQSTPGIIAVNVATFIGYNKQKTLGAVVATAGIVTPSLLIITFLAAFISNFSEILWVQKALSGINIAVTALLTKSVWDFGKRTVKNFFCVVLYLAAFIAMFFFHVHSVIIILVSIFLGIAYSHINSKNKIENGEDFKK